MSAVENKKRLSITDNPATDTIWFLDEPQGIFVLTIKSATLYDQYSLIIVTR